MSLEVFFFFFFQSFY